jgi:hypothetical protein
MCTQEKNIENPEHNSFLQRRFAINVEKKPKDANRSRN